MHKFLAALLVLLALQFSPGVGMADASAATGDTIAEAYAECKAAEQAQTYPIIFSCRKQAGSTNTSGYWEFRKCNEATCYYQNTFSYRYTLGCSTGTWDDVSKTCFDGAACLAKQPLALGGTFNLSLSSSRCDSGCEMAYRGQTEQLTISTGEPISIGYGGEFRPTGNSCATGDPVLSPEESEKPDQHCAPAPDGQTFCVKADGRQCYSAGSGRQICWRPGETGEKFDGAVKQVRVGGNVAGPGTSPPPYGAMYEPANDAVPIMAEYGWFRDEGPASDAIVSTTTQNYQTDTGVNASGSSPDQGENADGSSGTTPGNQGPGGSGTDGDSEGVDWSGIPGMETDTAAGMMGDSAGLWGTEDAPVLDSSGFIAGPRVCPTAPTFELYGTVYEIDNIAMCQLGSIIGLIFYLAGIAQSLWILGEK